MPLSIWWQNWWAIAPIILFALFFAYLALVGLLIHTIM